MQPLSGLGEVYAGTGSCVAFADGPGGAFNLLACAGTLAFSPAVLYLSVRQIGLDNSAVRLPRIHMGNILAVGLQMGASS